MKYSQNLKRELSRKKRKQASRRNIAAFFFLIAGAALTMSFMKGSPDKSEAKETPAEDKPGLMETIVEKIKEPLMVVSSDRTEIKQEIKDIADAATGSYGYYIYELDTKIGFGANEETQFVAASTNKIPILAKLYVEIEKGNVEKSQKWAYASSDYETGTGSLQYQKVGSSYTVELLAKKMIKESDNVATNIIIRNLGRKNVQALVDENGLKGIDMYKNLASPKAMSELLSKIYKYEIVNKTSGDEMLDLMTDTLFEKRLPRDLPDDVRVAHKIGTQSGAISDVGVVFLEDKPFVISVYNKNVQNVEEAEKTIGFICQKVYEFEKSR